MHNAAMAAPSGPSVRACRRAAIAMAVLGIYLEAMEWIDIYPWNNIKGGNGQEVLDYIIGGVLAVLVLWLWRWPGRVAAAVSLLVAALWGWLQVSTWWIPYVTGATPQWQRVYAKWFANSTQLLPSTPEHLPPDANHLVLHACVLGAIVTSLLALIASIKARRRAATGASA